MNALVRCGIACAALSLMAPLAPGVIRYVLATLAVTVVLIPLAVFALSRKAVTR